MNQTTTGTPVDDAAQARPGLDAPTTSLGNDISQMPAGRGFLALITQASRNPELAATIWNGLTTEGQEHLLRRIGDHSATRELQAGFQQSVRGYTGTRQPYTAHQLVGISEDPKKLLASWLADPASFRSSLNELDPASATLIRSRLFAAQRSMASEALSHDVTLVQGGKEQRMALIKGGALAIAGLAAGAFVMSNAVPLALTGAAIVVGAAVVNKYTGRSYNPAGTAMKLGRKVSRVGREAVQATKGAVQSEMADRQLREIGIVVAKKNGPSQGRTRDFSM